jgi:hypothetical protein
MRIFAFCSNAMWLYQPHFTRYAMEQREQLPTAIAAVAAAAAAAAALRAFASTHQRRSVVLWRLRP